MKRLSVLIIITIVLTSWIGWEGKQITGKVTSAEDGVALPGVNVVLKGTSTGTVTDVNGEYSLNVPISGGTLNFSFVGFISQDIKIGDKTIINVQMKTDLRQLEEVVISGQSRRSWPKGKKEKQRVADMEQSNIMIRGYSHSPNTIYAQPNTEDYAAVEENVFRNPLNHPLSTFSIDVDAASCGRVNGLSAPAAAAGPVAWGRGGKHFRW